MKKLDSALWDLTAIVIDELVETEMSEEREMSMRELLYNVLDGHIQQWAEDVTEWG